MQFLLKQNKNEQYLEFLANKSMFGSNAANIVLAFFHSACSVNTWPEKRMYYW